MKKYAMLICLCPILFLTGCWSSMELTERAFVTAIALDEGKEGKIKLTTQIYRPASEVSATTNYSESAFVNVTVEEKTIFEAIRSIATIVGRKPQFSHMQTIVIGEKLAQREFSNLLDFLYRDSEIGLNTHILIAADNANKYFIGKSLIENTLGRQLQRQQIMASDLAGNTTDTTLQELEFQIKSEEGNAMVSYLYTNKELQNHLIGGVALIKNGKMIGVVQPKQTEFVLMLMNQYKHGIIEIPCAPPIDNEKQQFETFEVLALKTKASLDINEDDVAVRYNVQIEGSIGDLMCSSIEDINEEKQFEEKIVKTIKYELQEVIKLLQKEKIDVIGIGSQVYKRKPLYWYKWKKDWPDRFAQTSVNIQVDVTITNSKSMNEKPFLSNSD